MTKRIMQLFVYLCIIMISAQPTTASERKIMPMKPAVVYVSSTKLSDRTFVSAALVGAKRAKTELGVDYTEYRVDKVENLSDAFVTLAKKRYSPIIALGYQNVLPVHTLAERYPNTRFVVIDGLVPPLYNNVQSSIFKDHEGAFLVGMIAALTSKTDHIGFIGGMDIPTIRNFAIGYKQGAQFAKPNIRIDETMIGTTPKAWSSPNKAFALAQENYARGADVIFAAAGGSGLGVLRAAEASDALAIGVDTNQNGLYPGHVLTSMVKRVDVAVYEALKNAKLGKWESGITLLGLKEGALDYAVDQNNKDILDADIIEKVSGAKERIINGIIDVENYTVR